MWKKHLESSWFRDCDQAYAGKDHSKKDQTFWCSYYDESIKGEVEKSGFKTLESAKKYVDDNCPLPHKNRLFR